MWRKRQKMLARSWTVGPTDFSSCGAPCHSVSFRLLVSRVSDSTQATAQWGHTVEVRRCLHRRHPYVQTCRAGLSRYRRGSAGVPIEARHPVTV